jgi:hypothetical protein
MVGFSEILVLAKDRRVTGKLHIEWRKIVIPDICPSFQSVTASFPEPKIPTAVWAARTGGR